MEANIGKFFDSIGSLFGGGDQIPWCDRDIIHIAPDWRQALTLKKSIEDKIAKASDSSNFKHICLNADGVIGIGITATAVGLIAGGIAAALARKK
ncbi:Mitochondrial fission 1 protein A [Morella rubra]|uniref:Mitochondrial fission 1 protein A n=1 Tax=Morella rubra TaxID=262757 RepID=A0A6A1WHB6_9ROSI|nr:Mitochondrial fission 1 protein A [Morella rubra]